MGERRLEFILQERVGRQHKIKIPGTVIDIIFNGNFSEGNRYYWNLRKEADQIWLAGQSPRGDITYFTSSTPYNESPKRTTIPDDVVDKKDLSEGDPVYFLTHSFMHEAENPSVLVCNFKFIEKYLLEGLITESDSESESTEPDSESESTESDSKSEPKESDIFTLPEF
jgi:hypothetical protein